ncbi:MAG: class I adenylate-forming enzyme family protein [Alishewanella agri]|nr:class I adenylate-forming enzyme family protein [Alishewanella agri]
MQSMTLLHSLEQANYQTTAIIAGPDCSFSQLITKARQIRIQNPALQHQAIALVYTDLSSFCAQLLAFDGWCEKLYLLPDPTLLPDNTRVFSDCAVTPPSQPESRPSNPADIDTQWLMATSGTTGMPKWISHSVDSLTRAVKINSGSQSLSWALCYQPTRFAGLQVVLQSLLSGATLADCSHGDAPERLAKMQQANVNAVSATPSLWRQLLMTGQLNTLSLKQITLGGEIADQAILDTLSTLFPDARLLHIYASTEAGVGFAVADKKAGFPASWLTQGHSGLAFKIDSQQHLWLKPPQQPDSKLADRLDIDGFLDTEDLVNLTAERVYFLGRASGLINVGGNKVAPEQVEQVLLQHPSVVQARVYGKSSSVLGQLVVADVQLTQGCDSKTLKLQLLQHCMTSLLRYQVPTQINFVDNMVTNASGKLSRQLKDKIQHD